MCPEALIRVLFVEERERSEPSGAAQHMTDVSFGLVDELIESCAPSPARLSAANDGLLSMNRTNAPAAHVPGKSVFQLCKANSSIPRTWLHNSVMCSICLI